MDRPSPSLRNTVLFLADDIVRLRYVSINGQFRTMLVVKMRRSRQSIDMVEYQITEQGMVLTSGIPQPWSIESRQNDPPLRAESAPPKRPSPNSPAAPRRKKR